MGLYQKTGSLTKKYDSYQFVRKPPSAIGGYVGGLLSLYLAPQFIAGLLLSLYLSAPGGIINQTLNCFNISVRRISKFSQIIVSYKNDMYL
jgi:hypothetical protein